MASRRSVMWIPGRGSVMAKANPSKVLDNLHTGKGLAKPHKIHQYRRIEGQTGRSAIYRCILPGCRHYLLEKFILNQVALCPKCGKEYIIDRAMLFPRPVVNLHCKDCNRKTYNRKTGQFGKQRVLSDDDIMTNLNSLIFGEDGEE